MKTSNKILGKLTRKSRITLGQIIMLTMLGGLIVSNFMSLKKAQGIERELTNIKRELAIVKNASRLKTHITYRENNASSDLSDLEYYLSEIADDVHKIKRKVVDGW